MSVFKYNQITLSSFLSFIHFTTDSIVTPLESEDELMEYVDLFTSEENDGNFIFEYEKVYLIHVSLKQNDFINLVTDTFGKENKAIIKNDHIIYPINIDNTLYILELTKIKGKRNQKMSVEWELELEKAIKEENYEEAARIKKILDKKTKNKPNK